MLLQKLNEYADRPDMHMPPRLYTNAPVRYIIELDAGGNFLALTDTAGTDKATKRGVWHEVPEIVKTSGVRAFILAGNADYVLGFVGEAGKPAKVAQRHTAFCELVDQCAVATADARILAVSAFLQGDPVGKCGLPQDFNPAARITFRVNDVFVIDLPSVQAFWADSVDEKNSKAPEAKCLICGLRRRTALTIEKVKGIPGGQMGGTSIISFNAAAFLSYNLESCLNAPVCESCGARFTKSLNALLRDQQSHIIIGNVAYVFWTREPKAKFSFATIITEPTADLVKQLVTSATRGREGAVTALDEEEMSRFYATALSGSGGRAVVREWIDTTVGEAKAHLARWFRLQEIVPQFGEYTPLNIRQLAYATVRTGDRNNPPPPNISRSLLRTALAGVPLPDDLLYQAVRRNRAERAVTQQRAALIKMVLLSQRPDFEEDDMVELDTTNTEPAYLCGRLLAVLENAQVKAINTTTIVDKFYGTASSAPATVFAQLIRGAQPHLSKLHRDHPGIAVNIERNLNEIISGLNTFPKTLTLQQQGIFALGYYHERARRWAAKPASDGTQITNASTDSNDLTKKEQIS